MLALLPSLAGCGGDDEVAGGAADLPGPVPAGVEFAEPPASALPAPDFAAELVDGTAVRGSELWADRPVLLVFTASFCERCREIHRAAAEAVDGFDGAAGVVGMVGEDDASAGAEYADELDLGHPVAVADETGLAQLRGPRAGARRPRLERRQGRPRLARRVRARPSSRAALDDLIAP